jgi:hypothetical protein
VAAPDRRGHRSLVADQPPPQAIFEAVRQSRIREGRGDISGRASTTPHRCANTVLSRQPVRYRGLGPRGHDPACCYDFDNTRRRQTSAGLCRAGRARYIVAIRGRIIDEPSASRRHSDYFRIGIRCRSNKWVLRRSMTVSWPQHRDERSVEGSSQPRSEGRGYREEQRLGSPVDFRGGANVVGAGRLPQRESQSLPTVLDSRLALRAAS